MDFAVLVHVIFLLSIMIPSLNFPVLLSVEANNSKLLSGFKSSFMQRDQRYMQDGLLLINITILGIKFLSCTTLSRDRMSILETPQIC